MAKLQLLGLLGLGASFTAAVLPLIFAGCGSSGGGSGGGTAGGNVGGNHAGGSGAAVCADLIKNATHTKVDVRLVNKTAANLYIQYGDNGSCGVIPFKIKDPNGDELSWSTGGVCSSTCADSNCSCTITCSPPSVTLIAPNGTLTIPWSGVVNELLTLPASCIDPSNNCRSGDQPCIVEVAPKSFPLTFTSTLWTEAKCGDSACTPCTPDASGTCQYEDGSGPRSETSGDFLEGTATFAAGGTSLDIVFQKP